MSSYHLAPDLMSYYLDAISRYHVTYLWGYTSSLYLLAEHVLRLKWCNANLRVVVLNAEPVYPYQRRLMSEAFRCPIRETYGMTEKVAAASECEHGQLHLWPDVGVVEVLEDGQAVGHNVTGDMVCTGLLDDDMPLIRYRVGDRASLGASDEKCECKRTLPIIGAIEGRADDLLYTRDGRRVGRLDPVFKANLPVKEVQIIQESIDRVRIRFVPAEGFNEGVADVIRERLQQRMGELNVEMEPVDHIPRGPNGKFRAVICNIVKAEHSAIDV
jgi:phenylacetate-CoA ligase